MEFSYSLKTHLTLSDPSNTYLTLGQQDLPQILSTLSSTDAADPFTLHFTCRALRKVLSTFSSEDELKALVNAYDWLGMRLINILQGLNGGRGGGRLITDKELELQNELAWCLINITGVNDSGKRLQSLIDYGLFEALLLMLEFDIIGERCEAEVKRCQMICMILENVITDSDRAKVDLLLVTVEDCQ